ncbi:MAG: prepilin-type N-terminal cleavage/methylation domain-containing protein [Candidatus Eisenbacteria sp.]|nr:prepilin-type N-terminal cleavage/methylation domain-containing protein [Candidatus Eisenbacteria bacterium]
MKTAPATASGGRCRPPVAHRLRRRPCSSAARGGPSGFTLVELLIVAIVLSLLAAVAIPHFGNRSREAKQAAIDQNLAILNKAVELYYLNHGAYPGTLAEETSWEIFADQLTLPTARDGSPGESYGPYLRTDIPPNPLNGSELGTIGTMHFGQEQIYGWHFDPATGIVSAYGSDKELEFEPLPPEPKGDEPIPVP